MKIKQLRERLLVFLAHEVGLPYFKLIRKKISFPYTDADLEHMPENTVGHQLHRFFIKHSLGLLPYYERHDIKHVLLDYPPTEEGEVCLQTFMLANGRVTFPVVVAVAYGWLTMPEFHASFKAAWSKGRSNIPLRDVNWVSLIPHELQEIRQLLITEKQNVLAYR